MVSRFLSTSLSHIKLYTDTISQPCRAVEMFLKINKIPYESVPIQLGKLEHYSEEFGKINPLRKVPVLDDNGFLLTESIAIFRYVSYHHKIADKWYPSDSRKRAAVDEYLEWQHIGLRARCVSYVWATFFTPIITGKPEDVAMVATKKSEMITAVNQLNEIWLKGRPYVTGKEISFADIIAACELEQLQLTGYNFRDNRPNLEDWIERVRNETNPCYDEVHLKLSNTAAKRESLLKSKLHT